MSTPNAAGNHHHKSRKASIHGVKDEEYEKLVIHGTHSIADPWAVEEKRITSEHQK